MPRLAEFRHSASRLGLSRLTRTFLHGRLFPVERSLRILTQIQMQM